MIHSSEVLRQRAIECGWKYLDGVTTWPGSPRHPYTGWLVSEGHATPDNEDSFRGFQGHDDKCVECGNWISYNWLNKKQLKEFQHCFYCDIYRERILYRSEHPEKVAVIDGVIYTIGDREEPGDFNGYAGRRFCIQFDDGRVVETCDLWCGGKIKERFLDRFPDNAVFVLPKPKEQATVTSWT